MGYNYDYFTTKVGGQMATFPPRKNGVLAEVRRRVNGRTIYKSRLFPNKKNAEAWAAELEAKLLRGILPDDVEADKTIFRDLLRRYWDEVASKNKHYIRIKYRTGQR